MWFRDVSSRKKNGKIWEFLPSWGPPPYFFQNSHIFPFFLLMSLTEGRKCRIQDNIWKYILHKAAGKTIHSSLDGVSHPHWSWMFWHWSAGHWSAVWQDLSFKWVRDHLSNWQGWQGNNIGQRSGKDQPTAPHTWCIIGEYIWKMTKKDKTSPTFLTWDKLSSERSSTYTIAIMRLM